MPPTPSSRHAAAAPLIVGVGDGEYLGRLGRQRHRRAHQPGLYLEDHEIARIDADGLHVSTGDAQPVHRETDVLETTLEQIELGGYPSFMLKEIHEQPEGLRNCMRGASTCAPAAFTSADCRPWKKSWPIAAGWF